MQESASSSSRGAGSPMSESSVHVASVSSAWCTAALSEGPSSLFTAAWKARARANAASAVSSARSRASSFSAPSAFTSHPGSAAVAEGNAPPAESARAGRERAFLESSEASGRTKHTPSAGSSQTGVRVGGGPAVGRPRASIGSKPSRRSSAVGGPRASVAVAELRASSMRG
eukprot:9310893-Pyramimonas_sp.AAC.1